MEQKRKIDIVADINSQMEKYFKLRNFGKRTCFTDEDSLIFNICVFPGEPALVIEYADNDKDAADGRFEDGDRFYLSDYVDENALFNAMLSEIKGA